VNILRRVLLGGLVLALVAGCATRPKLEARPNASVGQWSGRLALKLEGDKPQAFSAGFELLGNPQTGSLTLTGPFGSTAALLSWVPGSATLKSGNDRQLFPDVDTLIAHVTGTPVPAQALFDWLNGKNTIIAGWQADLSQLAQGRLVARQPQPPQPAELRIVLQNPRE
jgi:outer membrane lipoprotein LolB